MEHYTTITSIPQSHDKEDDYLLDMQDTNKLSSIVLVHLKLEHYIPLFQKAGIDLDRFLSMTEKDFKSIGLEDPGDLQLLCSCSSAFKTHLENQKPQPHLYQHIEEDEDDLEDFHSMRSSLTSSRLSQRSGSCSSSEDTILLTPTSIKNALIAFDSYNSSSSQRRTSSPLPPSNVVIPTLQTNTSSANELQSPPLRVSVPGTVIPRPRNKNKQNMNTSRPVSMPIQLPSFTTPPPDYFSTTIYGRRLEKCRSMIFPREEEGKEELPGYTCTVFKMGYVHVKKEYDAPETKSRYRGWRKLYIELWGTMLRVYRAAPSQKTAAIDYQNYYRWPLRAPYYYYHKYYYTPIFTISLAGAEASRALDYFRRPNALRLTTQQGPQLLLRLSSHVEMISWIEHLQAAINISLDLELRPMPKFITIPTRGLTTSGVLDPRSIELERVREQRRRDQREVLI